MARRTDGHTLVILGLSVVKDLKVTIFILWFLEEFLVFSFLSGVFVGYLFPCCVII